MSVFVIYKVLMAYKIERSFSKPNPHSELHIFNTVIWKFYYCKLRNNIVHSAFRVAFSNIQRYFYITDYIWINIINHYDEKRFTIQFFLCGPN